MADDRNIKIDISAEDKSANAFGLLEQRLRNMKKQLSGVELAAKTLAGAGAVGAFTYIGRQLQQMADRAAEVATQFREGQIGAAEMSMEIAKAIPLLGSLVSAGRGIREAITGEDYRAGLDAKRINDAAQRQDAATAAMVARHEATRKAIEMESRSLHLRRLRDPAERMREERRLDFMESIDPITRELQNRNLAPGRRAQLAKLFELMSRNYYDGLADEIDSRAIHDMGRKAAQRIQGWVIRAQSLAIDAIQSVRQMRAPEDPRPWTFLQASLRKAIESRAGAAHPGFASLDQGRFTGGLREQRIAEHQKTAADQTRRAADQAAQAVKELRAINGMLERLTQGGVSLVPVFPG
jgi:hypothetical protein